MLDIVLTYFVPRAGFLICGVDLRGRRSRNAAPQADHFVAQCPWYVSGALRDFPPSPKRTLAAAATAAAATAAAAAARAHQIPHTYLHAPSATVRPGSIVTDVRLQGVCFVMRREPLSTKEGIGGCKQSDRPGGRGCQPYGAWKSRCLSINMAERRILGPGPEMPPSAAAPPDRRRMRWDSSNSPCTALWRAKMSSRVAVQSLFFRFRQGGRSVLQFVEPGGRNLQGRSRNM